MRKAYQLIPAGSSSSGKTTESAVYGYVQKPEIVEFRGQYFYGPNASPASPHAHHYSPVHAASHHYSHHPGLTTAASDSSSSSWLPFSSGSVSSKISNKSGIQSRAPVLVQCRCSLVSSAGNRRLTPPPNPHAIPSVLAWPYLPLLPAPSMLASCSCLIRAFADLLFPSGAARLQPPSPLITAAPAAHAFLPSCLVMLLLLRLVDRRLAGHSAGDSF